MYHATNGGISASAEEAWAMDPLPYVRVQPDGSQAWQEPTVLPLQSSEGVKALLQRRDGAHGAGHPRFRWTRNYSAGQLAQALAAAGKGNALPIKSAFRPGAPSGRCLRWRLSEMEMRHRWCCALMRFAGPSAAYPAPCL